MADPSDLLNALPCDEPIAGLGATGKSTEPSSAADRLSLVARAGAFATVAHAGQVRKYTGEPYIVHPAAVADLVASVSHTPEMLAAAWLHDVVEDTSVTGEMIAAEFGAEVADLVSWLTDRSRPEDGNRATRKAIDRAHLADAPAARADHQARRSDQQHGVDRAARSVVREGLPAREGAAAGRADRR